MSDTLRNCDRRCSAALVVSSEFEAEKTHAMTTTRWSWSRSDTQTGILAARPPSVSSQTTHLSRCAPACFATACRSSPALTPSSPRRSYSTMWLWQARGLTEFAWWHTAAWYAAFSFAPTAITDWATPCERTACLRGVHLFPGIKKWDH